MSNTDFSRFLTIVSNFLVSNEISTSSY